MHECTHEKTTIRWRNRSVGLIGIQCDECGRHVGKWLKHSEVNNPESLDDWIEDVKPMETTERMPVTDADGTVLKYVDRETYNKYLSSDVWKRRREKVILRAGGVCEGCLTAPASEVHHLTYRNIYREFAFELVALCRSCHARAHGDK